MIKSYRSSGLPRILSPPMSRWESLNSSLNLLSVTSVLYWAIWIARNDVVFDNCPRKTFLQVLFIRGTYGLRQWMLLQWSDENQEHWITLVALWRRWLCVVILIISVLNKLSQRSCHGWACLACTFMRSAPNKSLDHLQVCPKNTAKNKFWIKSWKSML